VSYFLRTTWDTLPDLGSPLSNKITMYIHIICGTIVLLSNPLLFPKFLRQKHFHKWFGRIYLVLFILTVLTGLLFLCFSGAVGGPNMTVAFTIYGIISLYAAYKTVHYGYNMYNRGSKSEHRHWSIRVCALSYAAWFYRVLYILAIFFGYDPISYSYSGPLDIVFSWLFLLVPVIFGEIIVLYFKKRSKLKYNALLGSGIN